MHKHLEAISLNLESDLTRGLKIIHGLLEFLNIVLRLVNQVEHGLYGFPVKNVHERKYRKSEDEQKSTNCDKTGNGCECLLRIPEI